MDVLFGESEVDEVHDMGVFAYPHQEIIGFYVSMEDVLLVY